MNIRTMSGLAAAAVLLCLSTITLAQQLGAFERIKVLGPSLQGNLSGDDALRDVSIYLPPGYSDTGIAVTVREMDAILESYSVKHRSEIYPGDHVSGIHERITTHLMPMFSEVLDKQ
jgi:hypothetical protein